MNLGSNAIAPSDFSTHVSDDSNLGRYNADCNRSYHEPPSSSTNTAWRIKAIVIAAVAISSGCVVAAVIFVLPTTNESSCSGFTCSSDGTCISSSLQCDGQSDCNDGQDEGDGCGSVNSDTQMLDIIVILDGSASIGTSNFDIVKTWTINQTLLIYDKFGSNAQVEVLQYANKEPAFLGIQIQDSTMFEIPFVFGECVNNESCVTERINNMAYLNSATYTYYALRRATEWEFLQSSRYPNATKIVVVVTDGEATDSSSLPTWWSQYGATDIVVPFAVGIGNSASFTNQLRIIANGGANDTRVFLVGSFADMHQLNIADAIKDEVS